MFLGDKGYRSNRAWSRSSRLTHVSIPDALPRLKTPNRRNRFSKRKKGPEDVLSGPLPAMSQNPSAHARVIRSTSLHFFAFASHAPRSIYCDHACSEIARRAPGFIRSRGTTRAVRCPFHHCSDPASSPSVRGCPRVPFTDRFEDR